MFDINESPKFLLVTTISLFFFTQALSVSHVQPPEIAESYSNQVCQEVSDDYVIPLDSEEGIPEVEDLRSVEEYLEMDEPEIIVEVEKKVESIQSLDVYVYDGLERVDEIECNRIDDYEFRENRILETFLLYTAVILPFILLPIQLIISKYKGNLTSDIEILKEILKSTIIGSTVFISSFLILYMNNFVENKLNVIISLLIGLVLFIYLIKEIISDKKSYGFENRVRVTVLGLTFFTNILIILIPIMYVIIQYLALIFFWTPP